MPMPASAPVESPAGSAAAVLVAGGVAVAVVLTGVDVLMAELDVVLEVVGVLEVEDELVDVTSNLNPGLCS